MRKHCRIPLGRAPYLHKNVHTAIGAKARTLMRYWQEAACTLSGALGILSQGGSTMWFSAAQKVVDVPNIKAPIRRRFRCNGEMQRLVSGVSW